MYRLEVYVVGQDSGGAYAAWETAVRRQLSADGHVFSSQRQHAYFPRKKDAYDYLERLRRQNPGTRYRIVHADTSTVIYDIGEQPEIKRADRMKTLKTASDEELEKELARRRRANAEAPQPLPNPNFDRLAAIIIENTKELAAGDDEARSRYDDFKTAVYEAAVECVYGRTYWGWLRGQLE